jgi:hypothetical protein
VVARGLDIPDVEKVINFDMPTEIGRFWAAVSWTLLICLESVFHSQHISLVRNECEFKLWVAFSGKSKPIAIPHFNSNWMSTYQNCHWHQTVTVGRSRIHSSELILDPYSDQGHRWGILWNIMKKNLLQRGTRRDKK